MTDESELQAAVRRLFKHVDEDEVVAASYGDSYLGWCLWCYSDADGIEPDASGYKCHHCGEHEVYGADEILLYAL